MIKLKTITDKYKSVYAAGTALNVNSVQLQRWINNDAHINDEGRLYIQTKGFVSIEDAVNNEKFSMADALRNQSRARTIRGQIVTGLTHFKGLDSRFDYAGIIGGTLFYWDRNGRTDGLPSNFNLRNIDDETK